LFYQYLLTVKKIRDIKFIISSDFNQLPPVNDRISQFTDYENSPAFFELTDNNMLKLTTCRRSDKKLFDLVQFDNIPNVKSSDFNITTNFDNDIHICFTNDVRKLINNIKMKQLARKTKKCLKLPAQKNCEKSQDVKLNVDMPVLSKINNEKMNIFNNQRFTIIKIDKENEKITLKYKDNDNTLDVEFNNFQKFFLPAFSMTCHCAQGLTIDQKYTIHEFDRMDKKLRYVALSRSKKYEYINIMSV
jgi:ATP-dependent exoDNAse (exonuclease V) alpha subunit